MHIPVKVDYGVRALVDLAQYGDGGPIRASEIARRKVVPEPYLAQVLLALARQGLVRSQRGPSGGHALGMAPEEIRLSMVMACLGEAETVVGCLDDASSCVHVPACAQREVWRSVDEAIYKILDSTTIADLLARTRTLQAGQIERGVKPVAV